jgi:hypothetical protein
MQVFMQMMQVLFIVFGVIGLFFVLLLKCLSLGYIDLTRCDPYGTLPAIIGLGLSVALVIYLFV